MLRPIGAALGARHFDEASTAASFARRHLAEISHVETGTEGTPLAGQNDGAQALLSLKALARFHERIEHRVVERIHLVDAHEANIGDAAMHLDADPVFHKSTPCPIRMTVRAARRGVKNVNRYLPPLGKPRSIGEKAPQKRFGFAGI